METEKHIKRYQKQLAKTDILYRPYLDETQAFVFSGQGQLSTLSDRRTIL